MNKKHLLLVSALLLSGLCRAQKSWSISDGRMKTGKFDTVKSQLLVSACDSCVSRSIIGYTVYEQWKDNFVSGSTGYYIVQYLDIRKNPFTFATVWLAKKLEPLDE